MPTGTPLLQLYRQALDSLPEAIALFDAQECFVGWNAAFAASYRCGAEPTIGMPFAEYLNLCVRGGHVLDATGREDEWLRERVSRFRAAEGFHDHQLASGRWLRVQDRRLPGGGTVGIRTDITDMVERERSFRLLFLDSPVPMLVTDVETHRILDANHAAGAFYGYSRKIFAGLPLQTILVGRSTDEIDRFMRDRLAGGEVVQGLARHRLTSGEERQVRFHGRRIVRDGRPAVLSALFDVTEQQRGEEEVRRSRAFLDQIVDQVPIAIFVKDVPAGNRFTLWNRASEDMFGRSRADAIGRSDFELFGDEAAARFRTSDRAALDHGIANADHDEPIAHPNGSIRQVRIRKVALTTGNDAPRFVLGVAEDETERRQIEARILHEARHDALTGLGNRLRLDEQLAAALAYRPAETMLALLYLDLDGFKQVNDRFGHAQGDNLLRQVAARLRSSIRQEDFAIRLGGDEFVVLQMDVAVAEEAAELASRLIAAVGEPLWIKGGRAAVSASIGIALAPMNATTAAELLSRSDEALYLAKRAGKGRYRFARGMVIADGAGTKLPD